jgi:hypothetical protein
MKNMSAPLHVRRVARLYQILEEITMKTLTTTVLIITLLTVVGCAKQENPVPKVDLHSAVVTDDLEAIHQHIKAGSDLNVLELSRVHAADHGGGSRQG